MSTTNKQKHIQLKHNPKTTNNQQITQMSTTLKQTRTQSRNNILQNTNT